MAISFQSKIYVAGHNGLLGSAVLRALKKRGYENLLLRSSSELNLENQADTFRFFETEKPEYVFLCAAKVGGIRANMVAKGEFLYKNLTIQGNVFEAARLSKTKKLLFVGSSCIYPKNVECPIREETFLTGSFEPTNEGYALAKAAGVRMAQFYREQYGCDYIAAQPTNLYGINDHYDLEKSHLLPALIRKVHEAKLRGDNSIELWGTGTPKREFMLSDDCAAALVFLMETYSDTRFVNIGTGVDHSVIDLAKAVGKVLDVDLKIKTDPSKPDGMMRKVLDVSYLNQLGWKSQISLEEGIRVSYRDFLSRYGSK